MQEKQLEEHHVVCKVDDDDHMQIMIKGKRTKRQRLITMTSSSSENSGTVEEEEEDDMMANCLILLAEGHHHTQKKSTSHHVAAPLNNNNNNNNGEMLYLYQCKNCNRCFSSFQALGGHRVSHKKLPKSNTAVTTTFVNEDYGPTNTTLALQLSNRAMYSNSNNTMTSTYKSNKVHECSICGSEFKSGQALGGHMRRHRSTSSLSMRSNIIRSPQTHEAKIHRNVLKLDLNLPAPEDDDDDHDRESKFPFQSKEKLIAFSATSLVDRLPLLKFKSSYV